MTVSQPTTLQTALNQSNPQNIADLLRIGKIGYALSPVKVTLTALASASSFDITTAAVRAAATIVGISPALPTATRLSPIGAIETLRVTAGTATGPRSITDVGGTPTATVATLSDDGKTITFEAAVTAFVFTYFPRVESLLVNYPFAAP
jgi:hypothetical protein